MRHSDGLGSSQAAGGGTQPTRSSERGRPEEAAADDRATSPSARSQLDEDVDAILDEIDEVLEDNAEDFVQSFVQKGGQ